MYREKPALYVYKCRKQQHKKIRENTSQQRYNGSQVCDTERNLGAYQERKEHQNCSQNKTTPGIACFDVTVPAYESIDVFSRS